MAQSPAHKFGQIIGNLVEQALRKPLDEIARKYGLYLDYRHARPARRNQAKVAWRDVKGNVHDLDYVLETGGSESVIGKPRAFIEIAYRRYTKHSRNKAQEMQSAIIPLAETFAKDRPFLGVVLAGVFTEASVAQLRSHGIGAVYLSFDTIIEAFRTIGIDAYFDEASTDSQVRQKVRLCQQLPEKKFAEVAEHLRHLSRDGLMAFLRELESALSRTLVAVVVLCLHGRKQELPSIRDAVAFIQAYDESETTTGFCRYEINLRYTNGDEVRGAFSTKLQAVRFLENTA